MSFGLIVRDISGNIVLDPAKRITRFIGSFSTGTSSGSLLVSFPADSLNRLFFVRGGGLNQNDVCPDVTLAGSTFSWTFASFNLAGNLSVPKASTIFYGVY